jgi:enoyl-CoA hydratase
MASDSLVLVERPRGGEAVALVTLHRPERRNALSDALMAELADRLAALDRDAAVRAVVLTGDERAFAAGADIGEFSGLRSSEIPRTRKFAPWERIWALETPLIAAVRGLALGGGLELALACDLLVVAEDARLGQPEIRLGLIPGAGGTQRLAHALGKAMAMEMVLLGREIDGRTAYERGLANRCVSAAQVIEAALALADELAQLAPLAVRLGKAAVLQAFELPLSAGLRAERQAFALLMDSDDAHEGIAAFAERRKPAFRGR